MAKVILICGKVCAGKTTYAKKLLKAHHTIWLSCDDLMLALFKENIDEIHDKYHDSVENFLLKQAKTFVESEINVILDFGFWEKAERKRVSDFFSNDNIDIEWHYVDVSDETLRLNIIKRNSAVLANDCNEYYTDEGIMDKCLSNFEVPEKEEIDVWVDNNHCKK